MTSGDDLIEAYLDRLLVELRGRASDVRRILAEVEDHLRDAVEAGVAEGLALHEAERRAVARFGPPAVVARRFRPGPARARPAAVLAPLALALALVGGVGLVGIGASGAVAAGMGAAFGKSFVAGDFSGVTYTPARCADYLEYHPEAAGCRQAAAAHHFDEIVEYRLAAGVLGLLVLGAYAACRRSARLARLCRGVGILPDGFTATVGTAVFGVAGAVSLLQSLGQLAGGDSGGAGAYLSGGLVSALIGAGFLYALVRTLTRRGPAIAPEGLWEPSPGS